MDIIALVILTPIAFIFYQKLVQSRLVRGLLRDALGPVKMRGVNPESKVTELFSTTSIFFDKASTRFLWGAIGAAVGIIGGSLYGDALIHALQGLVLGLPLGLVVSHMRDKSRENTHLRSINFSLPIVMERLVMAVEAGLDIIPALGAITNLEGFEQKKADPVTDFFRKLHALTERGVSFESAITAMSLSSPSPALKHACAHLVIAHRDGGELVLPLRELSDATQLYYQENIEEEIAKMPVKATLPLLCTFAGLIVFFLTVPLIQVLKMTASVNVH